MAEPANHSPRLVKKTAFSTQSREAFACHDFPRSRYQEPGYTFARVRKEAMVLWSVGIRAATGDRAGYPPVVKHVAASRNLTLTGWLVTADILVHRVKIADRQS